MSATPHATAHVYSKFDFTKPCQKCALQNEHTARKIDRSHERHSVNTRPTSSTSSALATDVKLQYLTESPHSYTMCTTWQTLLIICVALVQVFASGSLEEVECSIVAILSNKREESEECNLRSLLRKQMVEQERDVVKKGWPWPRLEKQVNFGLQSCSGPGAVCRVEKKRLCICPKSYICDPVQQTQLFSCVKLTYFVHQE
ncbi:hypothetical protein Y032_0194g1432 [Ancylostoma ceylanicum]|nr:hypothetical protein Y032_0194g1432 [Ancylostoma ceylanicum]